MEIKPAVADRLNRRSDMLRVTNDYYISNYVLNTLEQTNTRYESLELKNWQSTTITVFHASIPKMSYICFILSAWGSSGGAMVLGKLSVPGRPTIWITVGQGPTALAVGAGGGLFGHFYSHLSFLSSFSLSLGDGPI